METKKSLQVGFAIAHSGCWPASLRLLLPLFIPSFHSTFRFFHPLHSICPFSLKTQNFILIAWFVLFCAPVCITATFRVDNLEHRSGVSLYL